jgi:endogenous inhibitor of DNA gyrase (YacG/DUF329 family)
MNVIIKKCTRCGKELQFNTAATQVYDLVSPICDSCDEKEWAKEQEYLRKAGMLK